MREPMTIFRRLLIVSLASVFVWQIEHQYSREAETFKLFLAKLSGLWQFILLNDLLYNFDITKILFMR